MTDAQIHAIARVFDQERSYAREGHNVSVAMVRMWCHLRDCIADEIKNMHGDRGKKLFLDHVGDYT